MLSQYFNRLTLIGMNHLKEFDNVVPVKGINPANNASVNVACSR